MLELLGVFQGVPAQIWAKRGMISLSTYNNRKDQESWPGIYVCFPRAFLSICGDQRKMLINTTVNENKHALKFQAPWLLLKASRGSNRCNKADTLFGCQGITFPTSDQSRDGGRIYHPQQSSLGPWSTFEKPSQKCSRPEWYQGRFPAPAKGLISPTDLHGTWIQLFIGFFHLCIYHIDLTKGITGLKEN